MSIDKQLYNYYSDTLFPHLRTSFKSTVDLRVIPVGIKLVEQHDERKLFALPAEGSSNIVTLSYITWHTIRVTNQPDTILTACKDWYHKVALDIVSAHLCVQTLHTCSFTLRITCPWKFRCACALVWCTTKEDCSQTGWKCSALSNSWYDVTTRDMQTSWNLLLKFHLRTDSVNICNISVWFV